MPELPEVETTRRALVAVAQNRSIARAIAHRATLRWPIPPNLAELLQGKTIIAVLRRGKYLLLHCKNTQSQSLNTTEPTNTSDVGFLLIHLGMSGAITAVPVGSPLLKHDHFQVDFDRLSPNGESEATDAISLRLNDPRRFGAVLWIDAANIEDALQFPLLQGLGLEPFINDEPNAAFTAAAFYAATRGKAIAIKLLLLSGKFVVGVGNIYCSEALFAAGINPATAAGKISRPRYTKLVTAILDVLARAIAAGGTTLQNYTNVAGEHGQFQSQTQAYGRAGQPCFVCNSSIRLWTDAQGHAVGGRATYFCPHCQKR